jgi:hypothetical protein
VSGTNTFWKGARGASVAPAGSTQAASTASKAAFRTFLTSDAGSYGTVNTSVLL